MGHNYRIVLAIPAHAAHRFIKHCTETTMGRCGSIIPTISPDKIFGELPKYIQDGPVTLAYENAVGKSNCYNEYAAKKFICKDFYVPEDLKLFSSFEIINPEGEATMSYLQITFYAVNGIPYTMLLAICKLIDAGICAWVTEEDDPSKFIQRINWVRHHQVGFYPTYTPDIKIY